LTGVSAVTPAHADPLSGLAGDGIKFKFTNFESFFKADGSQDNTISIGDNNAGIYIVDSINQGANTLFSSGSGNQYLVGVFSNITVSSFADAGGNTTFTTPQAGGLIHNTGGNFSLYLVNSATFGADWSTIVTGQGTAGFTNNGCTGYVNLCYNGITNVGTLLLTFDLAAGVPIPSDPAATLAVSGVDFSTTPTTGHGLGYGNATGGPDAAKFDNNGQVGGTDFKLVDDWCIIGQTGCQGATIGANTGDWFLNSNDPITTSAIPEPATLALFGTGLLGLGAAWRRRRKA
jgi:hypothetical protein